MSGRFKRPWGASGWPGHWPSSVKGQASSQPCSLTTEIGQPRGQSGRFQHPTWLPTDSLWCGHSGTASVTMARERQDPCCPHPAQVPGPWCAALTQGQGGEETRGGPGGPHALCPQSLNCGLQGADALRAGGIWSWSCWAVPPVVTVRPENFQSCWEQSCGVCGGWLVAQRAGAWVQSGQRDLWGGGCRVEFPGPTCRMRCKEGLGRDGRAVSPSQKC